MISGTVRWFSYSKGCGYISPDDGGQDVFAHFSEIQDVALESLQKDQRVTFRRHSGAKGPRASNICLTELRRVSVEER